MTPLEMARNAALAVERYAELQETDPLTAHVHHAGTLGHDAARLAGAMALVSIAEDLRRMADVMTSGPFTGEGLPA